MRPRPAIVRDAVVGALLALFGAYLGAAAIWTYLRWPGQHVDAVRVLAIGLGAALVAYGVRLIGMWLRGDWFEAAEPAWDAEASVETSSDGSDSGAGSGDGGSGGD